MATVVKSFSIQGIDAYPVDIVINLEERHAASTEVRNIRTKWRDCVELSDEFFSAC